jgi:hypothetical protein
MDRQELTAALAAALATAGTFQALAHSADLEQLVVLARQLAGAGNRLSEAAGWRLRSPRGE